MLSSFNPNKKSTCRIGGPGGFETEKIFSDFLLETNKLITLK
jgi:hypothetical protein